MNVPPPLSQQLLVFVVILAGGCICGLFFDLARALKKTLLWPSSVLFLADLLICLFAAFTLYQFLFSFHQGEVRFYIYLSFCLGLVCYYYFCSSYLYKQMLYILKYGIRLWRRAEYCLLKGKEACRSFLNKLRNAGE